MSKLTTIYALIDPRNNECRYVGKSVRVKARYHRHCNPQDDNKTHSACWVRSLLPLKPKLVILEEVASEHWVEAEQFWIAYMKGLGARLTNLTVGGEGVLGIKVGEETRAKMSKSQSGRVSPMKGKSHSEDTLKRMSEVKLGKLKSEETKNKMSEAQKGHEVKESTRAKLSESHKVIFNTPEMFAKMSKVRKGRVTSEETKVKLAIASTGKTRSAEARAKMSEKAKLREQRKKEEGYVVSEETRRKLSESGKGKHSIKRKSKKKAA